jgi:hypothetical protein
MAKPVLTPEGHFASVRLAAAHYDIGYETVRRRIRSGWQGWRFAEPAPRPVIVLASKPTRKLGRRKPRSA